MGVYEEAVNAKFLFKTLLRSEGYSTSIYCIIYFITSEWLVNCEYMLLYKCLSKMIKNLLNTTLLSHNNCK